VRPQFSLADPPLLFRVVTGTYAALVVPVGQTRKLFTGWPTAYSSFWVPPYRETAGVPPLAHALEHVTWAIPFWLLLLAAAQEVIRALRLRPGHRVATE
jgi:hypothetical protein